MKRLATIIAALFVFGQAMAQEHINSGASSSSSNTSSSSNSALEFGVGSNVVSLGVGFGGAYSYFATGYSQTPNIVLAYDRGLVKAGPGTISIGGLVSYKGMSYDVTDAYSSYYYDEKWTYLIIGVRGAYHYNFTNNPHCDPYAGILIAYDILSYSFSSNDPAVSSSNPYYAIYNVTYPSYVSISAYVGFRYFFNKNFGVYGELGYGYTIFAAGLNLKF